MAGYWQQTVVVPADEAEWQAIWVPGTVAWIPSQQNERASFCTGQFNPADGTVPVTSSTQGAECLANDCWIPQQDALSAYSHRNSASAGWAGQYSLQVADTPSVNDESSHADSLTGQHSLRVADTQSPDDKLHSVDRPFLIQLDKCLRPCFDEPVPPSAPYAYNGQGSCAVPLSGPCENDSDKDSCASDCMEDCTQADDSTTISQPSHAYGAGSCASDELGELLVSLPLSAAARRRRRRQRAAARYNALHASGQLDRQEDSHSRRVLVVGQADFAAVNDVDCKELLHQLELGGDEASSALKAVQGSVVALAFDPMGCRVVQSALDFASRAEAAALAEELRNQIRPAITSPYGNYVIQKILENLSPGAFSFVVEELSGCGAQIVRHRYGCRIISRLVEHSCGKKTDIRTLRLIDEILVHADSLCRHTFGHHAMRAIVEHGTDEQRHVIACALYMDLIRNAKHRHASLVVEKALEHCSTEDQIAISEMLFKPDNFQSLVSNQFGCYVVKALMRMHNDFKLKAQKNLYEVAGKLQSSRYGQRLLNEMKFGCVKQ